MSGSGMIDGRRAELLGDDEGAVLRVDGPVAADGYSCRDADELGFVTIPNADVPLVERFDGFMQFDRDRSVLVDDQAPAGRHYFDGYELPRSRFSWEVDRQHLEPATERSAAELRADFFDKCIAAVAAGIRHNNALGIIMLAAAKCTDVRKLADSGRIDRDGADLFIRRYSESIAEIVAELVPPASSSKGN